MREFKSVHDRHCCPIHGCKYGDADCPVVLGTEEGILCEWCDEEFEEMKFFLDKLFKNTVFTDQQRTWFEELKKDQLRFLNTLRY